MFRSTCAEQSALSTQTSTIAAIYFNDSSARVAEDEASSSTDFSSMSMALGEPTGFHPFFSTSKPSRKLQGLTEYLPFNFMTLTDDIVNYQPNHMVDHGLAPSAEQSARNQPSLDNVSQNNISQIANTLFAAVPQPVPVLAEHDVLKSEMEGASTEAVGNTVGLLAPRRQGSRTRRQPRHDKDVLHDLADEVVLPRKRRKVEVPHPSKSHPWFEQLKPVEAKSAIGDLADTGDASAKERCQESGSIDVTYDDVVSERVIPATETVFSTPASPYTPDTPQAPSHTTGEMVFGPKKTLQLNGKGAFALPEVPTKPSDTSVEGHAIQSKPRRRKAKRLVVAIRYGGDDQVKRAILGEKIQAIITMPKSCDVVESVRDQSIMPKAKPRESKVTHPFFLGKPGPVHEEKATTTATEGSDHNPSLSRQAPGGLCRTFTTRKEMRPKQDRKDSPSPEKSKHCYPQALRPFSVPGTVDPFWPYRGFAHIQPFHTVPSSLTEIRRGQPLASYKLRKQKDRKTLIAAEEDVTKLFAVRYVEPMQSKLLRDIQCERSLIKPQRLVISGVCLQGLVRSEISSGIWAPDPREPEPSSLHNSKKPLRHAALPKLYSRIVSSLSPFDSGEPETTAWTQKYSPQLAEDVLQSEKEVTTLKHWLQSLTVEAVASGVQDTSSRKNHEANKGEEKRRKKKRRKKENELDGFIVSSEDEAAEMHAISGDDEVEETAKSVIRNGAVATHIKGKPGKNTNAILLSGSHGSGKSAAAYAVAKELGFDVFEVNAGNRRTGKDVIDKVGDMARNHLVHRHEPSTDLARPTEVSDTSEVVLVVDEQQSKLKSFFTVKPKQASKPKPTLEKDVEPPKKSEKVAGSKAKHQKQSLILFEDVDVLFEEDRGFWETVLDLALQSKRPIILTCKDESIVPVQALSLHAILRFRPAPLQLATDYLLLIAAVEGHLLRRQSVQDLYSANNYDLRSSLMDLNFWCQMAVGDDKGGMDWFLNRWPAGVAHDASGRALRVVSKETYRSNLSLFGSETRPSNDFDDTHDRDSRLIHEAWNEWHIHPSTISQQAFDGLFGGAIIQDMTPADGFALLEDYANFADQLSAIDVLASVDLPESKHPGSFERCGATSAMNTVLAQDLLDPTQPVLTESKRMNYVLGYPLLQADIRRDYEGLDARIAISAHLGIARQIKDRKSLYSLSSKSHIKRSLQGQLSHHILSSSDRSRALLTRKDFSTAFDPIAEDPTHANIFPGLLYSSFDRNFRVIVEDLAPYIRGIGAYDLALEQQRAALSGGGITGAGSKRARTTRASRSALEGSRRAETRREKWFAKTVDLGKVMKTGGNEWPQEGVRTLLEGWEVSRENSTASRESSVHSVA